MKKSPYLLRHADNPVDWWPWGEEAFAAARREDKPVFLSRGYSTCHWCHVMAREFFCSEEVKAYLRQKPRQGLTVLVKTPKSAAALTELAPFTADYPIPEDRARYDLCRGGTCRAPVSSVEELE